MFVIRVAAICLLFGLFSVSAISGPSLKRLFQKDFLVGAALNSAQFGERDLVSSKIVTREFNTISPENALKWESIHPKLGTYDFSDSDRFVEYGEARGMYIVGHALVWHQQTPKEVFEDSNGKPVSREVLLARMKDHIFRVVGRYKGRIDGWDVVNEAVGDDGKMRDTPWRRIIGDDYIEKAFQFAHQADPKAELFYNDYSLENETKRAVALKLIKRLVDKKIPINGVGLQGHSNFSFPSVQQQDQTIKQFAALGVDVMITELDITALPEPKSYAAADLNLSFENRAALDPYKKGLPPEIERKLARRYEELFRVFVENRDVITRVTFWNVTDGDSWLNNFPIRGRTNYPLLFSRTGKPKLAYHKLFEKFTK